MSSPVIIKKYGNRRLYDTAASRYVNLDDIAALIRQGRDVKIVDARTGRDLSRVTLTQIITEDAKSKPTGLPLELLRQLIIASDEVRQEFIMWYLKSAFDTYQKVQDAVQSRLGEVQSAILSPVDMMKRFLSTAPSPPRQERQQNKQERGENEQERTNEQERRDNEQELETLRNRVADLEGRLGGKSGKTRRVRR